VVIAVSASILLTQPPPKPAGKTLRVITRHDSTIWTIFEPAFLASDYAKQLNIVDIEWISPDPGLWRDTIKATELDVAWGGGPTLFDQLLRDDQIQPLSGVSVLSVVDQIPDSLGGAPMKRRNQQGQVVWVAAAISSFGFTVNQGFLKRYGLPTPQRWEDLADTAYLKPIKTISMGNAPHTTSNTRIYIIILQCFGWDKGWSILTRMAGNAKIYSGSGISVDVQSASETGEVGVALSIDFYGYTSQLKNPDCRYIIPQGQSIINGDPIAVIKGTKKQEEAEAFVAWVLSAEGQSVWLKPVVNRMPVRQDAFDTPLGKNRTDLKRLYTETVQNIGINFDDDLALLYTDSVMYYFESVLTDLQSELREAWSALGKAKPEGRISDSRFEELALSLGKPISWSEGGATQQFTLEYAKSVNNRVREDSTFRESMKAKWTSAARAQYAEILKTVS
jgi:ABC-type Fe3+ transport system substrate-binding protein